MNTRRILKYELKLQDTQELAIPKGSSVLTVQMRRSKPCIWIEAPLDAEHTETIIIEQVLTGESVPQDMTYLTTLLLKSEWCSIHIYYRINNV